MVFQMAYIKITQGDNNAYSWSTDELLNQMSRQIGCNVLYLIKSSEKKNIVILDCN